MFENNVSDLSIAITAILPGSKLSMFLQSIIVQGATSSVFYVFPDLRVHICVDDMKLFLTRISLDVLGRTRKLRELLEVEMKSPSRAFGHSW